MFANWSEFCANVGGDYDYYQNGDYMQTITTIEEIQGTDFVIVYIGSFNEPWKWDGGAQIIVFYDDAYAASYTGKSIPLDGSRGVVYYFPDDYWDTGADPSYATDSGEIWFSAVTHVSGGPIRAEYSGHLAPYTPPDGSRELDTVRALGPIPF